MEVVLHHLEEPGVIRIRDVFQSVRDGPGPRHSRRGVQGGGGDPRQEGAGGGFH